LARSSFDVDLLLARCAAGAAFSSGFSDVPFRDCGTPEKSTCDVFRPEMKALGHVDKLGGHSQLAPRAALPGAAEKNGPRSMSPGTEQRKLAAIMFTDMVGFPLSLCWIIPCRFPAMLAATPLLFARRNIDISQAFCYKTMHVKGGLS
jgi:hypothetical protein